MGSKGSFEIEEDFDLGLLGVPATIRDGAHLKHRSASGASERERRLDGVSEGSRTPSGSARRPTQQYGRYVSADWTPDNAQHRPASGSGLIHPDRMPAEAPSLTVHAFAGPPARSPPDGVRSPPGSDVPSTRTEEGNQTVEVTDHDPSPSNNPRRLPSPAKIRLGRSRLPSGRLRPRVRLRAPRPTSPSSGTDPTPIPAELPASQFQLDVISHLGMETLEKLEELARQHNNTGAHLAFPFRDFFPTLSSNKAAVEHANEFRTLLELPLLSTGTDRVQLRRSIAVMRERLYLEIAAALVLPTVPPPNLMYSDHNPVERSKPPDLSLTPSSLLILEKSLPKAFPHDAATLKSFLKHPRSEYGEESGLVIWDRGVGRMQSGKHSEGFRGTIEGEHGVHIFVDHSNILHGLLNHLYSSPSTALPPRHLRTLSLPCLSLLLRRGRLTPPGTLHLVASSPLHQDLDPLVRLGWDVSVLKRVEVFEDDLADSHALKGGKAPLPNGHAMERHDTALRRHREQAVDEILCLKLLQTLNTKGVVAPAGSKIVLATGDARGGQFNPDGFLGAVKEALKRGWQVELWSWSEGLSRAWAETAKREKWGKEFHIHSLDPWAEHLVEVLPEDPDD